MEEVVNQNSAEPQPGVSQPRYPTLHVAKESRNPASNVSSSRAIQRILSAKGERAELFLQRPWIKVKNKVHPDRVLVMA